MTTAQLFRGEVIEVLPSLVYAGEALARQERLQSRLAQVIGETATQYQVKSVGYLAGRIALAQGVA